MKDATKSGANPERDKAKVQRLMEAHRVFMETGQNTVTCKQCGSVIAFRKLGEEAEESSCSCGKYNSTLRGL